MHLRTIKLRGFKSFPDAVEVALEPGVAVVVGPNGSGKSNVADAIVWAAGSLTPSAMRAEKPDDVLFSGGGDRAAADHCEVELVFDNEDGGFGGDIDFSEISISRRLVRGGEGQYLVNHAPVRRTDLVELLADVGLGGAMHSIVSQGKVDAVLASRAEDRRALIEEAAGLGKFKQRKHRAELKLARVAIQVERARDVEDEVRKRLRPLALQATAAERAERLAVEIAGLRATIARLDLATIGTRRDETAGRRDAAALARRTTQGRLQGILEEREQVEVELAGAAGGREQALGALYRLQGAGERLTLRHESIRELSGRITELVREREHAQSLADGEPFAALHEVATAAATRARDAAVASGQATERARGVLGRLVLARHAVAAAAEARLEKLRGERSIVEGELAAGAGSETASRALVGLGRARERLGARHERVAEAAGAARAERDELEALRRASEVTPAELEQAANAAQVAARATASERDELLERTRATRSRLDALDDALAQREGLPPAARALADRGERLALATLDVEAGSERAVSAALGWRASALLAGDPAAGLELLRRAADEGLGSLVVVAGRDPADLVAELPIVSLSELLSARRASVTPEGFGYDPDRGELWFAGSTPETVFLELEARRRDLVDELDELEGRMRTATAAASETAAAAIAAEEAYSAVAHLRGRPTDPAVLGSIVEVTAALGAALSRALATIDRLELPLAARMRAGATRTSELTGELQRLATVEVEARTALEQAASQAREAELALVRLGGIAPVSGAPEADSEALQIEVDAALLAADQARAEARTAADEARAVEAQLAERAPRRSGLDIDLARRLARLVEETDVAVAAARSLGERFESPVRARVDAGAHRASELGGRLRELGAAELELRQESDRAAERLTAVEVELARLEGETDEARRRLEEALAAGAEETTEADVATEDSLELSARLVRLESRREALGRVNPLAKEEYEAEKERLEALSVQRRDLEDSLTELERLRDELADTVARRFDETFAAVAANFEEVAGTLFPGGEGQLRLVEPEDEGGEPGIEVELRPAGKRITRLSLLSGGEKALGAISFLFALFLAKPCPFYLLDEVEAALDDTNIARFVELLRRYADRAQFVVITHQKRTMEAADVLYGVTMAGDGISQIVSRRLPRDERVAATA